MLRRLAGALAVCLVAATLPFGAASAAAPNWKGPTPVPGGGDSPISSQDVADPAGGSLLYYTLDGIPTLAQVSAAGKIGTPQAVPAVPSLGNFGTPSQIAFLPNGGAVISWSLTPYGPYMAYRAPSGKFGTPVALPGFGIAVRSGEILTEGESGTGIVVDDWTLSSAGVITHKGGPTQVYTGEVYAGHNPAGLSLDASGTADLVVYGSTDNEDTEQLATTFRNAHGAWQPQTQLSVAGGYVTAVSFATSPGGRAIVAWVDSPMNTAATMRAAIRVPGHSFGAATTTGSVSSPDTVALFPLVAAGTDGTLAVATGSRVYTTGTAYNSATNVRIAPPTASTLGGAHAVPGSNDALTLAALGAGRSEAITGLLKVVYGPGDGTHISSYTESQSTTASVISSSSTDTETFGSSSGTYDGNGGDGCTCAASPPLASITGVSLDNNAMATAAGQLTPGGVLKYATRLALTSGQPTITENHKGLVAASTKIPVTLACAKAACHGTLTVTTAGHKPVRLARASYSIAAGKHKTIKAKLTKAGKKALKHAKKHPVKAKLVVTVKGGKKLTRSISVS